jgi:hypothetical protein
MPRFASSVSKPSEQELEQRLAPVFPGVDTGRAAVAQRGLSMEQARLRGAEREVSRVAFKYGADSDRATTAAEAVRVAERRITALELETERALAVVQPDPNGIIVYGRVLDANFQGVPDLTVAIADAGGKTLARAETDERGAFRLAGAAVAAPANATTRTKSAGAIVSSSGASAAEATTARQAALVVTKGKREVYREPLAPLAAGQTRYREIVLPAGR